MRRFTLNRSEDETGISGTGNVADGVEFFDGQCVLRWRGVKATMQSTGIYGRIEDIEAIHGHEGKTVVQWIDEHH